MTNLIIYLGIALLTFGIVLTNTYRDHRDGKIGSVVMFVYPLVLAALWPVQILLSLFVVIGLVISIIVLRFQKDRNA